MEVALGTAVGLQALKFVYGLVEAPLYRGLVAGELGESVRLVGIPDAGSAECRALCAFSLNLCLSGSEESLLYFCESVTVVCSDSALNGFW